MAGVVSEKIAWPTVSLAYSRPRGRDWRAGTLETVIASLPASDEGESWLEEQPVIAAAAAKAKVAAVRLRERFIRGLPKVGL